MIGSEENRREQMRRRYREERAVGILPFQAVTSSSTLLFSWLDTLSIVSFSWAIFSAKFCLRVTSQSVGQWVGEPRGTSAIVGRVGGA